jgi:hypothetical protein
MTSSRHQRRYLGRREHLQDVSDLIAGIDELAGAGVRFRPRVSRGARSGNAAEYGAGHECGEYGQARGG